MSISERDFNENKHNKTTTSPPKFVTLNTQGENRFSEMKQNQKMTASAEAKDFTGNPNHSKMDDTSDMKFSEMNKFKPLSDQEKNKLQSLSRVFLYKIAECIYETRCPQDLPDFEQENPPMFSLAIQKSRNLRSLLTYKSHYGWFKIDIILSNPDIVIERWHMIHLPLKAKVPNEYPSKRELNTAVHRQFSQFMRSIYSMCNVLPAKSLILQLKQLPTNTRTVKAVCESFHALPAVNESFSEFETARIQFGPIVTPVGRTVIFCTHRIDLDDEIPRPIRTAQHYDFTNLGKDTTLPDLLDLNDPINEVSAHNGNNNFGTGLSYDPNASVLGSHFSSTPGSFSSLQIDDFIPASVPSDDLENGKLQTYELKDLKELIENSLKVGVNDKTDLNDIRSRFIDVSAEIDRL